MRRFIVGECLAKNIFDQMDPDVPLEAEFASVVVRALTCLYKGYRCFQFTGGLEYEEKCYQPDLALVANDYSHWFIIEVELTTHNLERHVMPQVRTFRYGTPQPECSKILARELGISHEQAKSIVEYIPRSVAVIANKHHERWEVTLQAHTVPLLTVALFRTPDGSEAIELNGRLDVLKENIGFGTYSSIDRSLIFSAIVRLPEGQVQIIDPSGAVGLWIARRQGNATWVTKEQGTPDIDDQAFLQLIRSYDGELVLRSTARSRG